MDLPDIDLSHLTEEERNQIEAVMKRQKDEEDKEAKIKRVLEDDLENYTQAVHQVSKEAKERGLNVSGAYCQICHKVKFADGVGHSCNYCQTKSCARCGGKVTLRSNKVLWVCNICRKKQTLLTKTGQWFQTPPTKTPALEKSIGVTSKPLQEGLPSQEKKQRLQDNRATSSDKENIPFNQENHPVVTRTGSVLTHIHRQYSMSNDDDIQHSSRHENRSLQGKPGDRRYDSAGDVSHLDCVDYPDKELYLDHELYLANKEQFQDKEKHGNKHSGDNFECHTDRMTYPEPRRHSDQDEYFRENFCERFQEDQFPEQLHYQNQRPRGHREHRHREYSDGSGNIMQINDRGEERGRPGSHRGERHCPALHSEKGHPPHERTPSGILRSPAPDRKKYGERHQPMVPLEGDGGSYRVNPNRLLSSPDPVIDITNTETQERSNDNIPKQHLDPSSAFKRSSNKQKESMIRNDSLSSDQSEHVRPPPPKPHKKTKGTRKRQNSSPSSSEEEIRSTPECTSCDDVESESVSEKGDLESYRNKSQVAPGHFSETEIDSNKMRPLHFSPGKGQSFEDDGEWSEPQIKDSGVDTSSSTTLYDDHYPLKHPVTWQRDIDNHRLIGRMILKKGQSDGSLKEDSSAILGLKVGRDRGKLGPFISKIRQGSIADTVGQLKEGDEVLEWNGQPLQGKDFSEVHDIINRSKREPQVQLVVARAMGSDGRSATEKNHQTMNKRSSQSSGYESASRSSKDEISQPIKRPSVTVTSPGSPSSTQLTGASPHGDLQLKLVYDSQSLEVIVTIMSAQNLPARDNKEARYPYVKMYLLPNKRENSKRKTQIVHKMCDPKWNQQFVYSPIRRSDMKMRTLELTVWDSNQTAKELIGQVLINLHNAIFDNEPHWYPLSMPDISHGPLPQPSSIPQQDKVSHPRRSSRDTDPRNNSYTLYHVNNSEVGGSVRRTKSGGTSYANTYPNIGSHGGSLVHYPQDEGYRPHSRQRHLPSVEQFSNDPANHYSKIVQGSHPRDMATNDFENHYSKSLHGKHSRDVPPQHQRQMPRDPHRDPPSEQGISPQMHRDLTRHDHSVEHNTREIHGSFRDLPNYRDHPRDIHRNLPEQPRRNSAGSTIYNRIEDKQHVVQNNLPDLDQDRQGRPTNSSQMPNQVPPTNQIPYNLSGQSFPSQGKSDSSNQKSGYPASKSKADPLANHRSGYSPTPGKPDQSPNQRSGLNSLFDVGAVTQKLGTNPLNATPQDQNQVDVGKEVSSMFTGLSKAFSSVWSTGPSIKIPFSEQISELGSKVPIPNTITDLGAKVGSVAHDGLSSLADDNDPGTQLLLPNNDERLLGGSSPTRQRRPGIMGDYTLPPRRRDASPSRDPSPQNYLPSRMQEYLTNHQPRRSYSLECQDESGLDYNPSGEPLHSVDLSPPHERQLRRDFTPEMEQRHRSYSPARDPHYRTRDYSPSRQRLMEPAQERRFRDPSPSREGRRRDASPSRDRRRESSPSRESRREQSSRQFEYDYRDSRRSRSPNRRANGYFPDGERRSQSEVREYTYDRPYRHMHKSRMRNEGSSLPGSPIRVTMVRGNMERMSPSESPRGSPRTSPTSSPTGQKRSRQLPQVPSYVLGRSERESAKQMEIKMKMNQYKQAASVNSLSPHGNGGLYSNPVPDPHYSRSRQRKQSPDNISIKSSDSNMSTLSDMSALTSASTMSVLSSQSERPRGGRKLSISSCPERRPSDLKAKMEERSPYPKKILSRSTSSAEVYSYDRSDGSISDSATDSINIADLKKRRTSLSKVAAFVGLNKKSNSTSNLTGKKRSTIQRSEEVGTGIVDVKRGLTPQASRESTDGSICSVGSLDNTNTVWMPRMTGNEPHFNDFLDGLGPSQLVGRQVLGTPALGDIQLSLQEKNGQLLVEVIQARGLVAKPSAKILPAPWVKLYLMDGNRCIGKRKTKIARRTLNPEYRQSLLFDEDYRGKVLRITVWGDYARIDKKDFLGLAEILLDNMSLLNKVIGWYKLFNHASLADIPPRSTTTSLDGSVTSLSSFKTF
ncbi:regulating synaptic membrane exocytosis protein 2-like isoform X3 [Antedon mediterranea]|uniref:regulating synaptic membrane exocytosis protein 2-like isoform X3 n=1 Tax=Antedon mediterranea TaxID=105859 RepID=UPI003AF4E691